MASTYLTRTFGSAGNRQSWTWSAWIKKTKIYGSSSSDREVWFGGYTASNDTDWLEFGTEGNNFYYTTSDISSEGNRLMRDPNAWFHAVVTYDGSNLKFYYNNELDFNNTSLSGNRGINVGGVHTIGAVATNQSSRRFNGLMSHVHFVDGAVLAPTVFGETDSTTGEWKIITSPTVSSYGTNGFFILKDGNSVTDQSGNGNNWTVAGGTLTKTEDNPSNVFATLNPLGYAASANYTLANGNTAKTTTGTTNAWRTAYGTMGASSGKYYWEIKITGSESSDLGNFMLGIVSTEQVVNTSSNSYFTQYSHGYGYHAKTGNAMNNTTSSGSSYGASITTNNILGVAMDLDNNKLYFSKDGVFQNSGVPTSGSTGTGAAFTLASGITYLPAFAQYYGAERYAVNFGNGFFETTEITTNTGTGYQDEDNNGRFYYDPPTNYRCLSTKGLNQ